MFSQFFFLSSYNIKWWSLPGKEYDIIAERRGIIEPQKMTTQELINTLNRYDSRRKVKSIRKKL